MFTERKEDCILSFRNKLISQGFYLQIIGDAPCARYDKERQYWSSSSEIQVFYQRFQDTIEYVCQKANYTTCTTKDIFSTIQNIWTVYNALYIEVGTKERIETNEIFIFNLWIKIKKVKLFCCTGRQNKSIETQRSWIDTVIKSRKCQCSYWQSFDTIDAKAPANIRTLQIRFTWFVNVLTALTLLWWNSFSVSI